MATRRLRRSSAALRGVHRVRGGVPAAVLGSEVWDLFGDRLRALLAGRADGLVDGFAGRRPWATSAPHRSVSVGIPTDTQSTIRPQSTIARPGRVPAVGGRPALAAATSTHSRPAVGEAAADTPAVAQGRSGLLAREVAPEAGASVETLTSADPRRTAPAALPPSTALRRGLDAYFAGGARSVQAEKPAARERAGAERVRVNPRIAPWAQLNDRPAWPELAGADAVRRIAALTEHRSENSNLESDVVVDPQVSIRNAFHVSMYAAQPQSSRELSDRVAAVLREQALQHGIDVT